jgi:hypothetical protein
MEAIFLLNTSFTYYWQDLLIKDMNSDGISDIIIVRTFSFDVLILLGRSDGLFGSPIAVNCASDTADRRVVVADFNEDHLLDVAVPNFYENNVKIWLGFEHEIFIEWTSYFMGVGSMPDSLAVGDLNSDTHLDIVAVLGANNSIVVLLGTGFGSFTTSFRLSLNLDGYLKSPVIADFNNDHRPDIALVNTWNHKVIIVIGLGNGSLGEVKQFYTGFASFPVAISVSDFDSDGTVDLAVTNRGSAGISVFYGTGNASFVIVHLRSDYLVDPGVVAIADFNSDNNQDIIVANMVGNKILVFLGDSSKSFGSKSICLQLPFINFRVLAVRYTNEDEPPDIIIGNYDELYLIRNQANYWTS